MEQTVITADSYDHDSIESHYGEADIVNTRFGAEYVAIAEDAGRSTDVELFICSLPYRESITLLFKTFGSPVKEIAEVLHLHPSRIYNLINILEKKHEDLEYN